MSVPNWVLRNKIRADGYGARLPKAETLPTGSMNSRLDICAVCKLSIQGGRSRYLPARDGFAHIECADALRNNANLAVVETRKPIRLPESGVVVDFDRSPWGINREKKFNEGNLSEEEYRFWVGTKDFETSLFAVCRGCRKHTYGADDRRTHMDDQTIWEDKNACTIHLTNAYRNLLKKGKCISCKGVTNRTKWGVPLCSNECQEDWKFRQQSFISLELELKQGGK